MARYYGPVGYAESVESPPDSGVWKDVISERLYYGNIEKESRRLYSSENLNASINADNVISIIGDKHAFQFFGNIRYILWEDTRWVITNVEVSPPRLRLHIGSVYNGPTP